MQRKVSNEVAEYEPDEGYSISGRRRDALIRLHVSTGRGTQPVPSSVDRELLFCTWPCGFNCVNELLFQLPYTLERCVCVIFSGHLVLTCFWCTLSVDVAFGVRLSAASLGVRCWWRLLRVTNVGEYTLSACSILCIKINLS